MASSASRKRSPPELNARAGHDNPGAPLRQVRQRGTKLSPLRP